MIRGDIWGFRRLNQRGFLAELWADFWHVVPVVISAFQKCFPFYGSRKSRKFNNNSWQWSFEEKFDLFSGCFKPVIWKTMRLSVLKIGSEKRRIFRFQNTWFRKRKDFRTQIFILEHKFQRDLHPVNDQTLSSPRLSESDSDNRFKLFLAHIAYMI